MYRMVSTMINGQRIMQVMKYLINRRTPGTIYGSIYHEFGHQHLDWNSADDIPSEFIRAVGRSNRKNFGMGYEICDSFKTTKLNVYEITSWVVWGLHKDNRDLY